MNTEYASIRLLQALLAAAPFLCIGRFLFESGHPTFVPVVHAHHKSITSLKL